MYVIALDGVLRNEQKQPVPDGVRLFRALVENNRVVVAADGNTAEAVHWMATQNLRGHAAVVGDEAGLPGVSLRVRQAERERIGGAYLVVVDSNPERCLELVEEGYSVLLFANSRYVRPEDRPTRAAARSWEEITKMLDERTGIKEHSDYE